MDKQQFETGDAHTDTQLYIASIFSTVDGETNAYHQGSWSTFVRLQGCRVGCAWCDTKYSWPIHRGGMPMDVMDVVDKVRAEPCRKVTITGGEPMEQWGPALSQLVSMLYGWGYKISMETAGTAPLAPLLAARMAINLIVDWKMPSAQARRPPILDNYALLRDTDVVKIVATLDEVKQIPSIVGSLRRLGCRARMVLSPVWEQSNELTSFITEARIAGLPILDVGINLQLHKVIWPNNVRDEEEAGHAAPLQSPTR